MNHYRMTLILHWKDLSNTTVVVYRSYSTIYNETIESLLLSDYELTIPVEMIENLIHITVDNVNYLGSENAKTNFKLQPVNAIVNPTTSRSSISL